MLQISNRRFIALCGTTVCGWLANYNEPQPDRGRPA
jgi:hypothetical protein